MRLVALGLGLLSARGVCSASRPVQVPRHVVQVTHARSSGPGGQNVNKVSTKVQLRLDVTAEASSWWLPQEVRERLMLQQKSMLTRSGELLLQCDETRSQSRNLALAFERLQTLLNAASIAPKQRVVSLEPPAYVKRQRVDDKRKQSQKKQARRRVTDY